MSNSQTKGSFTAAITNGSISGIVAYVWTHAILPWVLPLFTPIFVGAVARVEGFQWTPTLLASLAAFALVAHGLLRFDEWRIRRKVADKLILINPMLAAHGLAPDGGPQALRLGFNLASKADFPIEFYVEQVRSSVGNLQNPNPNYVSRQFVVPMTGSAFFWDDNIVLDHPIKGKQVEARIETTVLYGRSGGLRYRTVKKWALHAKFDDNGMPDPGVGWNETN